MKSDRAINMIRFIEKYCTLIDNSGRIVPFKLQKFQKEILRDIYEEVDKRGRRICRKYLFSCAKKNGKTELVAAILVAHMVGPESRTSSEIYSAAAKQDQAAIVFNRAKEMILRNDELAARFRFYDSNSTMESITTGVKYKALASQARTEHGMKPIFWIYDELAEAKDDKLLYVLENSMGAWLEPLGIIIGTKSDRPGNPMSNEIAYIRKLKEGAVKDPSYKFRIYEIDPADEQDVFDENNWYKANPGLGTIISLQDMQSQAEKAKQLTHLKMAFMAYRLNMDVDSFNILFSLRLWQDLADNTLSRQDVLGEECYLGVDLSSSKDLTSVAAFFPKSNTLFFDNFLPEEGILDLETTDRAHYRHWSNEGYLTLTPGATVEYLFVLNTIRKWWEEHKVKLLVYDRWRMKDLEALARQTGILLPESRPVTQSYQGMSPSIDVFERRLLNKQLRHSGNPLVTWCMSCTFAQIDPRGWRRPIKPPFGSGRIDPIEAAIMAIGAADLEESDNKSFSSDSLFHSLYN